MTRMRHFKTRIYPTTEQEILISKTFGCCRFVYNHFLEERRSSYKEGGVSLSCFETMKMLTSLKKNEDYTWLQEVDSTALRSSLQHLDAAYKNFFAKRSKYPKFHPKKNKQSFETKNSRNDIRIEGNYVRILKVGYLKCKKNIHNAPRGRILNATVIKEPTGKYFISLCIEMGDRCLSNAGGVVGLDVGLKEFYTDSNGKTVANPKTLNNHLDKIARLQRSLSRKEKGSNNYEKQRYRLAKEHEKVKNIRNDFLHKETTILANENQVVCVEDLNIKGMLRNHRLAKAISDVSWSRFFALLEYKLNDRGGILIKIPTFYPSSQTCSVCGHKNPIVKDLKVREWTCPQCGTHHDRDHNAAVNILNKGLELLAA